MGGFFKEYLVVKGLNILWPIDWLFLGLQPLGLERQTLAGTEGPLTQKTD